MKNSILMLSVAVTVLCGFLIVQKNHQMEEMRAHLAAADEARTANAQRAAQEERWNKGLRKELRERGAEESSKPSVTRSSAPALAHATNSQQGVNKMFRDQLMKETLGAEAKVGAAKSVQRLFGAGLAARLQLNDNQTAALHQLLLQRASIFWDQMLIPMATGDLSASDTGAAGQAVKQAIDENESQIRALLGDDGYNTWQWFDKTEGERDEATEFAATAANAGVGLTPDQQNQLSDLMTSERANFNFQYDISDPSKLDFQHWLDNFSEDRLTAYQQDMEQLNSRIVQGSQSFLTPDQASQLNEALAQKLLQSMVTVRGTLAMMTGGNP